MGARLVISKAGIISLVSVEILRDSMNRILVYSAVNPGCGCSKCCGENSRGTSWYRCERSRGGNSGKLKPIYPAMSASRKVSRLRLSPVCELMISELVNGENTSMVCIMRGSVTGEIICTVQSNETGKKSDFLVWGLPAGTLHEYRSESNSPVSQNSH